MRAGRRLAVGVEGHPLAPRAPPLRTGAPSLPSGSPVGWIAVNGHGTAWSRSHSRRRPRSRYGPPEPLRGNRGASPTTRYSWARPGSVRRGPRALPSAAGSGSRSTRAYGRASDPRSGRNASQGVGSQGGGGASPTLRRFGRRCLPRGSAQQAALAAPSQCIPTGSSQGLSRSRRKHRRRPSRRRARTTNVRFNAVNRWFRRPGGGHPRAAGRR